MVTILEKRRPKSQVRLHCSLLSFSLFLLFPYLFFFLLILLIRYVFNYFFPLKKIRPVYRSKQESYQCDAISSIANVDNSFFEDFHVWRLEWQPGGYVKWYIDGEFKYSVIQESLDFMGTKIPLEPSSIILNTGKIVKVLKINYIESWQINFGNLICALISLYSIPFYFSNIDFMGLSFAPCWLLSVRL